MGRILERLWAIVAGLAVVLAVSIVVARTGEPAPVSVASVSVEAPPPATPAPAAPTPKPLPPPRPPARTVAVGVVSPITPNAFLKAAPSLNAPNIRLLGKGMLLPVVGRKWGFYRVMTPDEVWGWVIKSKVRVYGRGAHGASKLEGATIVLDPGHGGHLSGAKGPTGLREKDANLDIVRRLAPQLKGAQVFLTRGQGHAGLKYRSMLANRLNADAFISVHNNAAHAALWGKPGTDTFYQQRSPDSKRLAGILYEEVTRALGTIKGMWARDPLPGAKFRKGAEGDYYAVLRQTHVPSVIVENMFISNPREEALLRQPKVRQLLADALARGIKRYFTTNDQGSGFVDPYAMKLACSVTGCVLAAK
jgi:N-acetylmuramoyl-L-alanine amidase